MMATSIPVLLVLTALLQAASGQDLLFEAVPCQGCQSATLGHYSASDCSPVFDSTVSECCPASFMCRSEEERGISVDQCVYDNRTFAVGQKIPVGDPCSIDCSCREGFPAGYPAKVECIQVECPSLFNPLKPGCRNLYSIDKCCEVDEDCSGFQIPTLKPPTTGAATPKPVAPPAVVVTRSAHTCASEGKEYKEGSKVYFDETPCQLCVCTSNYTDAFGPGCRTIDCHMEYRGRKELRDGCTPLYFDTGCCNIDWICPESTRVKPTAKQLEPSTAPASNKCTLGKISAARSEVLPTDDCTINCVCATPPAFTCIEYSSCEEAAAARESGVLH